MKTLRKLINTFLVIFLVLPFFAIQTSAQGTIYILAPDTCSKDTIYIAKRINKDKYYIVGKDENTGRKKSGAFIERMRLGENALYDEANSHENFSHVIEAIDSDNYIVAIHYTNDQLTPILKIARNPKTHQWHIKSCHIIGRIGLPSTEVYIEKMSCGGNLAIKSAVASPDIESGTVYNRVIPTDTPDEFTDIISFFSAFMFK